MSTKSFDVDFSILDGRVYAGRERGIQFRKVLNLDTLEQNKPLITVFIPEETYSVTSSFFLGLFGPSIVKAGSKEEFKKKFSFEMPEFLIEDIDSHIVRALQISNI